MNGSGIVLTKKSQAQIHEHFLGQYVKALVDGGYQVEVSSGDRRSVLAVVELGKRFVVVVTTSSPISESGRPIAKIHVLAVEDGEGFHELEQLAKQAVIPFRQHLSNRLDLDLFVTKVINVDIDNWSVSR